MTSKRVVIIGAAGRDFHNFLTTFRDDASVEVVAFTAAQIPGIDDRGFPASLAGPRYPRGIPIHPEEDLEDLIATQDIDECVFAYSDVSYDHLGHLMARCNAAGADFRVLGPKYTMVRAARPVVSVCAVRTGCGKSAASRAVVRTLRRAGLRVIAIRHPMPYGDLARQGVQRFATIDDLRKHECTIEEMEEYEPHIDAGGIIYAGIDYTAIVRDAEKEADVILWDGGNNDLPFYESDFEIVLVDPHRAGDELRYVPGETNLRRADAIIVSKSDTATPEGIAAVKRTVARVNPRAVLLDGTLPLVVEGGLERMAGKRVLCVEDGPTLTHGGMKYGAAVLAARKAGAKLVDPRPFAVGGIAETFRIYPEVGTLLPAMGYGAQQMADLQATISAVDCDLVVIGTPIDLSRVVALDKPSLRVRYELEITSRPGLAEILAPVVAAARG
ncbi:MAG: cyclic 2,3-diphosphoglycerate synthase [Planctomycetota bacterium]